MPTAQNAAEEDEEIPCTPGRKVVKRMASVLLKPKVSYVSLVSHAANGLPFTVLKTEDVTSTEDQPTSDPMPKNIPSFGSAGACLNRLEFDLSLFKSEEAVKQYLKESTIEATRIEKSETHYIVHGVNAASLTDIEAVKGDQDGVTYFIGKLKAPRNPTPPSPAKAATTVPVQKSEAKPRLRGDEDEEGEAAAPNEFEQVFKNEMAPEFETVVTKMDSYIARQIKTTTLDETMATGTPEIPGLWEIMSAVRITVENIVTTADAADFSAKIQAAFARGGQIAAALAGIFVTIKKDEEGGSAPDREALKKYFSSPEPTSKGGEAGVEVKKTEDGTQSSAASTKEESATPDGLEAVVMKALEPVSKAVADLAAQVVEVKKSVDGGLDSLENRVVGLETVRQSRQSLPDDGDATDVAKSEKERLEEVRKAERDKAAAEEAEADRKFRERQNRDRFGLSA